MNRQLRQIKRYLEQGPEPGCTPFDRYAYNAFAWQARWFVTNGKNEEERTEAARLRDLACQKSREMQTQAQDESQRTA